MQSIPVRTTVIGSYPFPGWLEFGSRNLNQFGAADIEEMIEDAVIAAVHDQVTAGLDVITDGEQTRTLPPRPTHAPVADRYESVATLSAWPAASTGCWWSSATWRWPWRKKAATLAARCAPTWPR